MDNQITLSALQGRFATLTRISDNHTFVGKVMQETGSYFRVLDINAKKVIRVRKSNLVRR